ncbi:mannose-6-phosphate isomerase-like protein (cupin superfamily) [Deinobacterium chartae]|uniref:Mannose-6-phosphate isomerase-like protein (Cupin superfamily) n=1 Tax=Deinobacterium chartae TaxID=521158 RepID=A0A841HVK7_9DEIO|nr:cupin domain-containing protein [Deinobacterium chartae]MBB6096863.1 mannose-6-phosphate isomerase-like protein (cupin superfamily) [Deinobacterium chartae]
MISRENAEHYTWGIDCDGWHLVRSADLSVIHERMPPGRAEQRHRHARSRQFFFVLRGVLTLELEGREHTLGAHQGLEVPPGAAHQAINRSDAAAEFLVVSQPRSHGDREDAPR